MCPSGRAGGIQALNHIYREIKGKKRREEVSVARIALSTKQRGVEFA